MSSFIEQRFISLIAPMHDRFKWVVPGQVANCRCLLCGDSQKSKYKARGYFYIVKKSDMFCYKCQNCGASMSFKKYLKLQFPHYSKEMRLEIFAFNRGHDTPLDTYKPQPIKSIVQDVKVQLDAPDELLTPLSSLPDDHISVKYCLSRKIPRSKFSDLYYTKNYREWVTTHMDVGEKKYPKDERLVLLMKDKDGKIFGAQGRTLTNSSLRYSTIKFDESKPKLFGLDKVDTTLPIFVLEGVIDSLFIPNSLAICGGDIGSALEAVGVDFSNFIVVLDNEPRKSDTVRRMMTAISLGCKICIWDVDPSLKDVNEMISHGMSRAEILKRIGSNIYSGSKAIAKLKHWKKV